MFYKIREISVVVVGGGVYKPLTLATPMVIALTTLNFKGDSSEYISEALGTLIIYF